MVEKLPSEILVGLKSILKELTFIPEIFDILLMNFFFVSFH